MSGQPFDLRRSGIESVGDLPWGSHFCVFYASARDVFDIVVPFIKAGLESNEFCSWEVPAPLTVDDATRALTDGVPDFAKYVALGQVEIVQDSQETEHQREPGEVLERRLDHAILAGFDSLRCVCHVGSDTKRRAVPALTATVRRLNIVAAILYPRAAFDAAGFMHVVQDHRFALVSETGRWQVLEGSEARNAREALERTEQELQALFRNMSEGFAFHRIVLDARGEPCDYVFLDINPAFEHLTGLDAEKIRGKRVTQVIPGIESDPTDWIGRYGRVALTGAPARFESYAAPLEKWYAVSAFSPHKGYFAVTFADITDSKQAEADRRRFERELRESEVAREREARREAEIANRAKDEFLANVSHELRSPLNAILGWAVMLRSDRPIDEQTTRRALEASERGARAQRQLIDDLLDLARITSGKLRLDVQTVELVPVIEAAVDSVRPTAEAKGVRLHVIVDPKAAPVSGDPDRLQQIVWNLLSNAIKFTDKGGRVQVRLERVNSHVEIVVADSGAGIDHELIPHVFERFRQGASGRKAGGLGLGLAIVRELVELHGGTVEVDSPGIGQGTTFTVRLPLRAVLSDRLPVPAPAAPALAVASSPTLDGVRVLAVDDEPETRAVLRVMLESAGAEARVVASAKEAMEALKAEPWDVLVSDVEMPECDGYGLIRRVRQLDSLRGSPLPAVALTAYARTKDRVRAITAGFDIHVAKPVEPVELLAVVASLAARSVR